MFIAKNNPRKHCNELAILPNFKKGLFHPSYFNGFPFESIKNSHIRTANATQAHWKNAPVATFLQNTYQYIHITAVSNRNGHWKQ